MMNSKTEKNTSFNYKRNNKKNCDTIKLFNCFYCGYHSKAIFKFFIKGYENKCILQAVTIHPEKDLKIINISSDKIINDGELIKETICGNCGRNGSIHDVPKGLLSALGYNMDKEDDKKNPFNTFIKKVKDVFN